LSQLYGDSDNGSSWVKLASAITTASDNENADEKEEKDRTAFYYKIEQSIRFILIG
jgi:hypothetical protein